MPKAEKHNYRSASAQNNISVSSQQQQQQSSSRPMTLITEVDNCRGNRQVHSEVSNMPVGASSSFPVAADGLSSALAQLHLHQQQQQRLSPSDLHWLAGAIARSSSPASRHQLLAALSRSVSLPANSSAQADVRGQVSGMQHVSTTQPPTAGQQPGTLPVSRYKTELCRSYEESGHCRYGDKCQFAHGCGELRSLSRHPKYKTERCRTFHTVGFCAYGSRCHFIHDKDEEQVVAPAPPRHHQKQQPVLSPTDSCQSSLSSPMSAFEDADVGTSSALASGSLHLALLNLVNEEQETCSVHSMPLSHGDVISASSSASCSPQPAVWQDGYHAHWSPLCSLDVEMYGYPTFFPSSHDFNEHKQQLAGCSHVFTFNDAPSSPSAESQASSSGSSSCGHASDDSSSATYSPTLATKHTTFASLLHP